MNAGNRRLAVYFMKSLRRSYWYFTAFISKHAKTMISAVVIGVVLFAFILPLLTRLPQIKKTSYVGVIGTYNFANLPLFIQQQISSGLTSVQEDGTVVPELAERWTIEDDGKTYRFVIKEGIRWQDGKELQPSDIQFNFQDTQVITTENEVVFKLTDQFSPFPSVVSQPLFREIDTSYFRFFKRRKIVGVGNYRVSAIKYHDNQMSELIIDSSTERIIYRFYLTDDRAKTAFKLGKIDTILELSDISEFADWETITIQEDLHTDQYLGVFFNINDPLFQKNVRQGLSYGLLKSSEEVRAKGPIDPKSWAYLEGVKSYAYEPDRAISRLVDEVPKQPLQFSITTTARFQVDAENIKQQWEQLGTQAVEACQKSGDVANKDDCQNLQIDIDVNVSNFPDTSNYQVMLIGQQIPIDPDQYSLWHSTQNTNFTQYKNPRIDALLENGRKTTDQTERKAIYQEFQQFLLEDSPAIFIRYLTSYTIRRE